MLFPVILIDEAEYPGYSIVLIQFTQIYVLYLTLQFYYRKKYTVIVFNHLGLIC